MNASAYALSCVSCCTHGVVGVNLGLIAWGVDCAVLGWLGVHMNPGARALGR